MVAFKFNTLIYNIINIAPDPNDPPEIVTHLGTITLLPTLLPY